MANNKFQKKAKEEESRKKIINRVSRIEGQLRGVRKMIEDERDCVDVIGQVTAVREALNMLGVELLKDEFICRLDKNKKIDEAYLKSLFKMK